MAPKQAEAIDNPPVPSSSEEEEEEEEEESASSGEESESSGEDSKSENDGDDLTKPIPVSVVPIVKKKPVADSEAESNSDSDPETTKTPQVTKSVPESSQMTAKSSTVHMPESSAAKRPLAEAGKEDPAKKKTKTSTETVGEEEVKKSSGDETKKLLMFQRLFSEKDEIALLQGILDFTATRGDPFEELDAFCEYVKKFINFDANRAQLVTKVRRLKKKFANCVKKSLKKGKSEDDIRFSKDSDQKAFELSRKIWGNNGVLASTSRKKFGGNSKEIKLYQTPPKRVKQVTKTETSVVNSQVSGRDIASFIKKEFSASSGLDESYLIAGWDMVAEGSKKKEIAEKLKKLKAMEIELCLQRTGLLADTTKMIFGDYASSSGK